MQSYSNQISSALSDNEEDLSDFILDEGTIEFSKARHPVSKSVGSSVNLKQSMIKAFSNPLVSDKGQVSDSEKLEIHKDFSRQNLRKYGQSLNYGYTEFNRMLKEDLKGKLPNCLITTKFPVFKVKVIKILVYRYYYLTILTIRLLQTNRIYGQIIRTSFNGILTPSCNRFWCF